MTLGIQHPHQQHSRSRHNPTPRLQRHLQSPLHTRFQQWHQCPRILPNLHTLPIHIIHPESAPQVQHLHPHPTPLQSLRRLQQRLDAAHIRLGRLNHAPNVRVQPAQINPLLPVPGLENPLRLINRHTKFILPGPRGDIPVRPRIHIRIHPQVTLGPHLQPRRLGRDRIQLLLTLHVERMHRSPLCRQSLR